MGKVADMVVRDCKASEFADCDVVFSGLDSDVAGDIGASLPRCMRLNLVTSVLTSVKRWNS